VKLVTTLMKSMMSISTSVLNAQARTPSLTLPAEPANLVIMAMNSTTQVYINAKSVQVQTNTSTQVPTNAKNVSQTNCLMIHLLQANVLTAPTKTNTLIPKRTNATIVLKLPKFIALSRALVLAVLQIHTLTRTKTTVSASKTPRKILKLVIVLPVDLDKSCTLTS